MQKILQKLAALSCQKLHWWVVAISILIAAQVQYIQNGWINPDSVLYLESAKAFSNGNWKAGFDIFEWPLYSLCITLINKITLLGVHVSAQILNVIFFAIATYSFIKIITLAGGKQRQIIAGALIWLSAQYMIGGVLEMLMRDEGFWAFYLLGLVFFIRFYQKQQIKNALLWQVCIIVATLFRIEAILYLLFLPFILLFQTQNTWQQKVTQFLKAHMLELFILVFSELFIIVLGKLKFDERISYHTILSKCWALCLLWFFIDIVLNNSCGFSFVISFWYGLVVQIEILMIAFILKTNHTDVPSVLQAINFYTSICLS